MIALEQAIVDLRSQITPNYYATVKIYYFNVNIFKNRFTGKTVSKFIAQIKNQWYIKFCKKKKCPLIASIIFVNNTCH